MYAADCTTVFALCRPWQQHLLPSRVDAGLHDIAVVIARCMTALSGPGDFPCHRFATETLVLLATSECTMSMPLELVLRTTSEPSSIATTSISSSSCRRTRCRRGCRRAPQRRP